MTHRFKNEEIINENADHSRIIKLSLGNSLLIDKINNQITLLDKGNKVQVSININPDGIVLNLNTGNLNINVDEELNFSSKKINIEASEMVRIISGGNLVQEIKNDSLYEIGGTNKMIAQVQKITANLGNVEIKANDMIKLNGELVELNCD